MANATLALAEHRPNLTLPRQPLVVCRSRPVRAIVFDMDGVLVDSRRAAAAALAAVARQEGARADGAAIEAALDKGNSAASIVSYLLPHLNGQPTELDRVARAYSKASVGSGLIVKTQIACCLPALSTRFGMAIATNRTEDAALEILDRLKMRAFFGAVMTLSDAPPKPDPKMVLLAVMAVGANIASAVFVGDKPSDMMAGKVAGVRTIIVDGSQGKGGCWPFLSEFGMV